MVDTRTCIGCNHEWTVFDQTSDCEYTPHLEEAMPLKFRIYACIFCRACVLFKAIEQNLKRIKNEFDQEIPQSQIADQTMTSCERDTRRQTKKHT